jgi:hypothetical protein
LSSRWEPADQEEEANVLPTADGEAPGTLLLLKFRGRSGGFNATPPNFRGLAAARIATPPKVRASFTRRVG